VSYLSSNPPLKKPWRANFEGGANTTARFLGVFETEEEAAIAWNEHAASRNILDLNLIRELKYEYNGTLYSEEEWDSIRRGETIVQDE